MKAWLTAETLYRYWEHAVQALATTGLRLAIIFVAYVLARQALVRFVDGAIARIQPKDPGTRTAEERARRLLTLQTLVRSVIQYVLFFVLVLTVLQTLGVNTIGILTTAGVAGVAIGFGAQKLVRDVISGFFLVTEDQFAVGDYVTIGQATGIVEEMGLRTTRIRDAQGRLWALANGDITFVVNHSRGPVTSTLDVPIPVTCDFRAAAERINALGEVLAAEEPALFELPPRVDGVAAFDAATTTLRVRVSARPTVLAQAEMKVRERLRNTLEEEGFLRPPG